MLTVLENQLRSYERSARKVSAEEKVNPRDVETLIDLGVRLLEATEAAALRDAQRPGADIPALARHYGSLYRLIDSLFDAIARAVQGVQSAGLTIAGADRLRDARGYLKAALSITPEQLAAAEDDFRRGRGVPLDEVMDEIVNRVRV